MIGPDNQFEQEGDRTVRVNKTRAPTLVPRLGQQCNADQMDTYFNKKKHCIWQVGAVNLSIIAMETM